MFQLNDLNFYNFFSRPILLYVRLTNIAPKITSYLIILCFVCAPKVHADNFERKWIFETDDFSATNTVQAQLKEHLGKLLLIDLTGNLIALDKQTGKQIYRTYLGAGAGHRGFTIDRATAEIAIAAGLQLLILDVDTGEILRSKKTLYSVVAPIITDSCYIVFGMGEIQCHDKNLDGIKWKTIIGRTARIWSNATYSKKNDSLYFVTSNPGGIVYKKDRYDEYSSSLISINASTGQIVFSKRMIKNDVWDFDGVGKPIYVENYSQGESIGLDIIIGTNKTGTIFAVNASNGEDVKRNQFKTVNFTTELGEATNIENSQLIPNWPKRISEIKIEPNDLRVDQLPKFKLRHAKFGEFVRPSPNYDVVIKGLHGGPEWHGGIYYQDKVNNQKLLAYPTNNTAWILRVNYVRENPIILRAAIYLVGIAKRIKTYLVRQRKKFESFFQSEINANSPASERIESRWNQDVWSNSDIESKVINNYYKYLNYDSYNKNYRNYCASCHGFDRNGKYQSELHGDGFIPSLVGYTLTDKFSYAKNYENFRNIHDEVHLPSEEKVNAIFTFFNELDMKLQDEKKLKQKGFWQILLGQDSLPLNKGPWGSVRILDLNTGDLKGSVVVGKSHGLNDEVNSSVVFGGLGNPTIEGNTMLTGTVDSSAYYISLIDQKVEAIIDLERSGSVNPYLTEIDNCEAWVFVETGGRFSFYNRINNGFTVEAFINKNNCS